MSCMRCLPWSSAWSCSISAARSRRACRRRSCSAPTCIRSIWASRPERMPLLETRNLTAFYGDFQALYGIDVMLDRGETVAIIGANGAGKSTFLKSVAGLIHGAADSVLLDGVPIGAKLAAEIVKLGIALVPEGRRLFPSLTV